MSFRFLNVFWDGRLVGQVKEAGRFNLAFQYDRDWLEDDSAPAISISLPKSKEIQKTQRATAFFANLGYEGQSGRELIESHRLAEGHLLFGFLARFAQDTAEALVIQPSDAPLPSRAHGYEDITNELTTIIAEGMARADFLPRALEKAGHKLNFTIAGAQDKIALHREGSKFLIPAPGGDAPTTWLLKPDSRAFKCIPENELYCLDLARAAGFPAPQAEILQVEDEPFFLIQRYDRYIGQDGLIKRLHQEDFCQALHLPPERKYQRDQGPGFADAHRLLSGLVDSGKNIQNFVRLALFNFLIGNADAHGKNFSLLYDHDFSVGLAPVYDLVSTQIYDEISPHFSMSYGKQTKPSAIDLNAWKRFAKSVNLADDQLAACMLGLIDPVRNRYERLLNRALLKSPRFQRKGEKLGALIKSRLELMETAALALARQ